MIFGIQYQGMSSLEVGMRIDPTNSDGMAD